MLSDFVASSNSATAAESGFVGLCGSGMRAGSAGCLLSFAFLFVANEQHKRVRCVVLGPSGVTSRQATLLPDTKPRACSAACPGGIAHYLATPRLVLLHRLLSPCRLCLSSPSLWLSRERLSAAFRFRLKLRTTRRIYAVMPLRVQCIVSTVAFTTFVGKMLARKQTVPSRREITAPLPCEACRGHAGAGPPNRRVPGLHEVAHNACPEMAVVCLAVQSRCNP